MAQLVDTHAHLTDPRLAPEVAEVVARAVEAGVRWIVTVASDLDDSERTIATAERFPQVYATVGVHPHAASSVDGGTFGRLEHLAGHPRVVALGETGLDYHYDNSPRDLQREAFRRHLELAARTDLPVVVHARDADDDVLAIIQETGWRHGVLHCFSSGPELLEGALELGWYISFAGMITFPKWDAVELLRSVPRGRLLVETDSPYLAPVPHRGKRNEPGYVGLVAERVAALRGDDPLALMDASFVNATNFYGIG
jgi:TatD DNase family protein